jgi:endonuclease/exonuclease/phosphatase family metal-dependent hydrolase
MRILHWNIHSWTDVAGRPNAQAVADLIRDAAPDVVSLTEVNEPWGRPETLSRISGYTWIFAPSVEFGSRGYGNALLTRVPVTAVQHVCVYSPEHGYQGTEPTETRSATVARLSSGGMSVWVGSTHFPATLPDRRETAARTLRRLARGLGEPWIICGDFNAPAAELFAGLPAYPDPAEPTYPAGAPATAIDYFLTSPGMDVKAEVLPAVGSDHLALLATARLG